MLLLVAGLSMPTGPAAAGTGPAKGTIRLTVTAPEGVPATTWFVGRTRHVAAKPPAGSSTVVTMQVPVGAYVVPPVSSTIGGVRYVG
ncbi:hypothetical protein JCM9533A_78670 [Catenuloplanes niger JCM 9533]